MAFKFILIDIYSPAINVTIYLAQGTISSSAIVCGCFAFANCNSI